MYFLIHALGPRKFNSPKTFWPILKWKIQQQNISNCTMFYASQVVISPLQNQSLATNLATKTWKHNLIVIVICTAFSIPEFRNGEDTKHYHRYSFSDTMQSNYVRHFNVHMVFILILFCTGVYSCNIQCVDEDDNFLTFYEHQRPDDVKFQKAVHHRVDETINIITWIEWRTYFESSIWRLICCIFLEFVVGRSSVSSKSGAEKPNGKHVPLAL